MKALLFMLPTLLSAQILTQFQPGSPGWRAINDNVMGGRSEGGPVLTESGHLRFAGIISLENRGGFSSIRSDSPAYALPGDGALVLRLRGDGRSYAMDLRTDRRQGATSFRRVFDTRAGDGFQEIRLPLSSFRPSAFGRDLPVTVPLDPTQIVSIGFTLSDGRAGPFRIDLAEIRFEPATPAAAPLPEVSDTPARDLILLAIARGAPLYNQGRPDACAAIYEVAAHALLRLPEDQLAAPHREALRNTLAAITGQPPGSPQAWALRRSFDQILADLP